MERAALLSRDSIACVNKCNLEEIITTASENNVRLRKKLDLIKYEKEKVSNHILFRSIDICVKYLNICILLSSTNVP